MTEVLPAIAEDRGVLQLVFELEDAGMIDAVSLTITDPSMSYDTWEGLLKLTANIDRSSRWWIGDLIIQGETLYGEEAAQAVEATPEDRYDAMHRVTGLDQGTLMNLASLCRRVPKERRRVELSPAMHVEVQKLEPDDQVRWLKSCIENGWTRDEFRSKIKESLTPPAPEGEGEGDSGAGDGTGDGLTLSERIEKAARLVWDTGEPTSEGHAVVPSESWAQLGAALGEE